jgi:DNA-binding beta-propeller fold protein YncE
MLMAARRSVVALVVSVGVLVVGLVGAGAAFGALAYPFVGQLAASPEPFGYLSAGSVAVDAVNGDRYVADSGTGAVDVFSEAGVQLAGLNGALTPSGSFGPGGVSNGGPGPTGYVSVAANDGTGDVYVLDSTHGVVDVFSAVGDFVCQITGRTPATQPEREAECNGAAGSLTPAGGLGEARGIAVDQATGDVYVVDAGDSVMDVFSVAGAYVAARSFSLASVPGGFSKNYQDGIAVDDKNGDVYMSESQTDVVRVFTGAGVYVTTWTGSNTPAGSFGGLVSVAADDSSGDVYVTDSLHGVVDVLEPSGAYLATPFAHAFHEPLGVEVDQSSGGVLVADRGPAVVDVFEGATLMPTVDTVGAGEVDATSAKLEGTVDPEGVALSDCRFDYGTSEAYGQSAPCAPAAGSIPTDSNVHPVSAQIAGLVPGTTYHFRLQASNANCPHCTSSGADVTLQTPPAPSIDAASATNVTSDAVDLNALIDPNGYDTSYRVEYGTSTAYGTSVPVPDADIGAGTSDVAVVQHITGLSADATYHWRVLAHSVNGTTRSVDHTFVYSTGGEGLPDGRAYEMITPPRHNAAVIGPNVNSNPTVIAEDGSRVIMGSVQCFGGTPSCTGERFSVGDVYLFERTPAGWVTHPLAPPASRFEAHSLWGASADADTALFSAPSPPGGQDDWYAREPDGSFREIGPVTAPAAGPDLIGFNDGVRATTADLSHLVWDNILQKAVWPFDETRGNESVYEYVGGGSQPALVGVSGPAGSTSLISECGTYPGDTAAGSSQPGTLSADGGTVFFTALVCSSGSGANAGVPVPANTLYARIDGSRTVLISGRSPLDCVSAACQSSLAGNASFAGASVDGSKAFFTSTQQLTDSASQSANAVACSAASGKGCNLYEYDFDRPAGHNLVAVSAGDSSGAGPRVQGVVAISGDGSHVYFIAKGVLTATANEDGQVAQSGAENLYVFESDASHPEGHVAFIATLPSSDENNWVNGPFVANVTPDGRFLVFTSAGDLTADDTSTSGAAQVFRYDAQTEQLVRISIGENGFNDNGNAGIAGAEARIVPAELAYDGLGSTRRDPTMSHDGSFVFFQSPVALTPHALDDVRIGSFEGTVAEPLYAQNVYEYHEGHVYLISDGRDTTGSRNGISSVSLEGSDATGANVFFSTADALVPQDTDGQLDVYDARICSVSEPCAGAPSVPAAPCGGEACHGASPSSPPAVVGATVSFSGQGNLTPTSPVVKTKVKQAKKRKVKAKQRRGAKRAKKRKAKSGAVGRRGKGHTSVRGWK